MTSPQPTSSGDAREDHAQQVGAKVGAAVAQAELVVLATIALLAKRIATGSLLLAMARRRLSRTTDTVLTAAVQRALLSSGQAATDLTPYLTAAVQSATDAAQAALTSSATFPGSPADPLARLKAAQKALDDLGRDGLTGFVDKAGRRWNLATYTEMATRTAVSNAIDAALAASLTRAGADLVVVGTHSTEGSCALCRPWLGRTLSLTGATPGLPALADAKAAGFRHPNCRCSWGTPGALAAAPSSADLARSAAMYESAQRQRAQNRREHAARRRTATAITPQARASARRELGALHVRFRHLQHPSRSRRPD